MRNPQELVRRWPVFFARLANKVIGWTDSYCYAGCGYPITNRFTYEVEKVNGIPILMAICGLDGPCMEMVGNGGIGAYGVRYSEVRPEIIEMLKSTQAPSEGRILLSLQE